MDTQTFKVLILGGGTGGISIAARLAKKIPPESIAILESSQTHYYQPLWTLVGGGVVPKEMSAQPQKSLIPKGVHWIKEKVASVSPSENKVITTAGNKLAYEHLVVATGLKLDFHKIAGVEGNLGKDGVGSIYDYEGAEAVHEMLEKFRGGRLIFTMPPVPIKCAGAPQKIMYLADEILRRNGVREKSEIVFTTAGKAIFGVSEFAKSLMEVVRKKSIQTRFSHKLVSIDAEKKVATFEVSSDTASPAREELSYDFLHVVPPQSAHDYVSESGLAAPDGPHAGWLWVDFFTLQHKKFPNVFGIGDVTGVPNSKTGAAIRKQAPVVAGNLLSVMRGETPRLQYDGYSSCPLVTGFGKVILAEFGYDGKLMPSFPMDQTKERRSMWFLKRYFLPLLYWRGMLKGRA